jgi:hypothetical protein
VRLRATLSGEARQCQEALIPDDSLSNPLSDATSIDHDTLEKILDATLNGLAMNALLVA